MIPVHFLAEDGGTIDDHAVVRLSVIPRKGETIDLGSKTHRVTYIVQRIAYASPDYDPANWYCYVTLRKSPKPFDFK